MKSKPSSPPARKLLVTSALPYANGPIHIGHLVEYVQTDVWVRFQRLMGHQCLYFCADDAHGTAVMLKARALGITPEELITQINREHLRDFTDFHIQFDHWHSTHSPENRQMAEQIWQKLKDKGLIISKTISQLYDPVEKQFLSDRMVVCTCPKCKTPDQFGDSCAECGASYELDQLTDVRSIFGSQPVRKQTEHYFFDLPAQSEVIQRWLSETELQPAVVNKLKEWLDSGLKPWDISRDAPYFGFTIPDHPDKYFYVWLDAPIGYIATSWAWSKQHNQDYRIFWAPDSDWELHHFIGKDIAYFHTLFWPALLHAAEQRLPTQVHCHGFLTFDGQKMSKSRGTLIEARQWLRHFDPEYLRYYLAAKLNGEVEDIDFNLRDFQLRINADLIGKLYNIGSRCQRLLKQHFDLQLAEQLLEPQWLAELIDDHSSLQQAYLTRNTNLLIRTLIDKADNINNYIQKHQPWHLVGVGRKSQAHGALTDALCAWRALNIWLNPILPEVSRRVLAQFNQNVDQLNWHDALRHPLGVKLQNYQRLGERLTDKAVADFINTEIKNGDQADQPSADEATQTKTVDAQAGKGKAAQTKTVDAQGSKGKASQSKTVDAQAGKGGADQTVGQADGLIELADFNRADLRVVRVLSAELVEGADRLLKIKLDAGVDQPEVLAGIRQWYAPEQLRDRMLVMVHNIKPRRTRFGLSQGMLLAASGADKRDRPYLIFADQGAEAGMRLR